MTFKEIRTTFTQRSGRYDLVVDATDYEDAGANFFILAGQKLLEAMELIKPSRSKHFSAIADGDNYLIFQHCRAVEEVWLTDAEERTQLEKRDLATMKGYYNEPASALDTGTPLYYAPCVVRTTPETTAKITIESFGESAVEASITEAERYTYNAIVFGPPADGDYELEIVGLFWLPELSANSDTNYWTVVRPDLLVMAALYKLELFYRNTKEADGWFRSILFEASLEGMDAVAQEVAEISEMEG
jgi:hypothetical protein